MVQRTWPCGPMKLLVEPQPTNQKAKKFTKEGKICSSLWMSLLVNVLQFFDGVMRVNLGSGKTAMPK
jgi:hypothetical protein